MRRSLTNSESDGSQILAILNETRKRSDAIVEGTRNRIARACVPIDPACSGGLGVCADAFDQCPPYTSPSRGFLGEHVLEVADGMNLRGRTVEKIVRKSDQLTSFFGDERVDRFVFIEKALQCHLGHL